MPISSSEIAQLNGSYQSMAMNNMAYSSMVGQGNVYGGGYSGQGGDRAMSGAMNMASSVGVPLAAGAIGLAGLDPMSLGLRAGMGAFAGGAGFGGAMAVGGAVALPLMAAGAAVNYAGGQMMQGASQQQELNAQLRGSFNFRNQYGGSGFQRGDMSSIGSMIRDMSDQVGPGGEMASFKELSTLAGKMGQMGFAQGVRDVKEFSARFKEMVTTLKTMATDLGTTLEGAMEFAQAGKSSGVFGMPRMQGFTAAARGASVSGGLAMSEVTGAASIGSQISRSIGGLGRQGAMAGVRTIGQIGTAQQMGILSEEDIYNVTGLTGAEGRQAYAASAMGSSAKFLQSGRGRRLLASIAGKDGTLDESAVNQLLEGGMGISETMKQDQAHLGKVGRANFIRNEGRLRGAALERLGGFLPGLQMMEWAQSKGVDINNMDDRSMLFAQRQLGMGRDEVDQAIKMAQNMPQILRQQQSDEQSDRYFQGVAQARKGQGIQGVQQRFNQAKEQINNALQKVGQDVFNQGSDMVDRFFNKLFGTYVQTYSKDIDQNYQQMMRGGTLGHEAAARAFGIGNRGLRTDFTSRATSRGGAGKEDLAAALGRGSDYGSAFSDGKLNMGYLFGGQSGASKLRDLGYNIKGMNSQQIQAKLLQAQAQQAAAATGFDEAAVGAAKGGDFLSRAYSMGSITGRGDERQAQIEALIRRQADGNNPNDPNVIAAKAMLVQLDGAKSPTAKAALIGNYERAQGVGAAAQLGSMSGLGEGGMAALLAKQGQPGYLSTDAESKAFANALGIKGFSKDSWQGKLRGWAKALGGVETTGATEQALGATDREREAGEYAKSEKFRDAVTGLFSQNKEIAAGTAAQLRKEIDAQVGKPATGDLEVKRNLLAGQDYLNFMRDHPNATEEDQQRWLEHNRDTLGPGVTIEGIKKTLGGAAAALDSRQAKDREEAQRRAMVASGKNVESLKMTGVMDAKTGRLSHTTWETLTKAGGKTAEYAAAMVSAERAQAEGRAVSMSTVDANAALLAGLTVEQKRQVSATLGGAVGGEASYEASLQSSLERGERRGKGRTATVAGMLGTGLKAGDLKGSDSDNAAKMLQAMGVDITTEGGKSVAAALQGALGQKDKGKAAQELAGVMSSKEVTDARKKKDEAQQESDNPLQAAIKKNTDKTNELLKLIATSSGVTADQIAKLEPKDAEK
jgi:hypothetical protein